MGYTHYWTQRRSFTKEEWATILNDIGAILKYAQHDGGVPLADGMGKLGTSPQLTATDIRFNGVDNGGENDFSHETFYIERKIRKPDYPGRQRGFDFCKTAEKPYDPVVVACLCYLSTITRKDDPETGEPIIGTEAYEVSSDGRGGDWLSGLDLARKALPAKANLLDLPMEVMERDRWCAPWINTKTMLYEIHFCVDGKGYVIKTGRQPESYCFESHKALAQFLERTKRVDLGRDYIVGFGRFTDNYRVEENIWNAMGSFDPPRHKRIEREQVKILDKLFPVDPACAQQPPAYVRPGEMPANAGREFCYSIGDLLALAD